MNTAPNLNELSTDQLKELASKLLLEVQQKEKTIQHVELENSKLKYEMAILKRHKFARTSEALDLHQRSLLDDLINEEIAGIEEQLAQHDVALHSDPKPKSQPRRAPLPPELPRTVIPHDPASTLCACGCQLKRIGEDVSEKLDYIPGTFTVGKRLPVTRCAHAQDSV